MCAKTGWGGGEFQGKRPLKIHVSIKETNYNHTTTRPFGARTIHTKFSFFILKLSFKNKLPHSPPNLWSMLFWMGWCVFSTIQGHFGRTLVAKPYNMSINHQANVFEFQYTLSSSGVYLDWRSNR